MSLNLAVKNTESICKQSNFKINYGVLPFRVYVLTQRDVILPTYFMYVFSLQFYIFYLSISTQQNTVNKVLVV